MQVVGEAPAQVRLVEDLAAVAVDLRPCQVMPPGARAWRCGGACTRRAPCRRPDPCKPPWLCGRGPTRDIVPSTTLRSCGSSSEVPAAQDAPTRVMTRIVARRLLHHASVLHRCAWSGIEDAEAGEVDAVAGLPEQDRAGTLEADRDGASDQDRRERDERKAGHPPDRRGASERWRRSRRARCTARRDRPSARPAGAAVPARGRPRRRRA